MEKWVLSKTHCANEKLQFRMEVETKLLKLSLGEKTPNRMYQKNKTAVCIQNTKSVLD